MSDAGQQWLAELSQAADRAYQVARREVFDRWPVGRPIERSQLTDRQCEALDQLAAAEARLEAYRAAHYRLTQPVTVARQGGEPP